MIVYVESNFLLERALLRDDHEACDALLALARTGEMRLLLPTFSLGESYEAWVRRRKRRTEIHRRVQDEMHELARSKPYASAPDEMREALTLLNRSNEDEKRRLDEVLREASDTAELIPLDAEVVGTAVRLQRELRLPPQDSLVFASVLAHLPAAGPGEKCFITRNTQDFEAAPIRARLAEHGCRLLTRFADGLGYVRSR